MPKQNRTVESQADEKKRIKAQKPEVDTQAPEMQPGVLEAPEGLLGLELDPTVQAQAARLGDPRLRSAQRQALAARIGKGQGNQHLQRVISAMRQDQGVQPKLEVSEPGDEYEQEADEMAEAVMKTSSAASSPPPADDEEEVDQVRRSGGGAVGVAPDLETRIEGMKGGGQPLPDEDRTFFEERMGTDLSDVRVHTDSSAAQTAQGLQARAYTVGGDIAFNDGEYEPGTTQGRELLAHELTHVVQQGGAGDLQRKEEEDTTLASDNGGGVGEAVDVTTPQVEQAPAPGGNGAGAESAGSRLAEAPAVTGEVAPGGNGSGPEPAGAGVAEAPTGAAPAEAQSPEAPAVAEGMEAGPREAEAPTEAAPAEAQSPEAPAVAEGMEAGPQEAEAPAEEEPKAKAQGGAKPAKKDTATKAAKEAQKPAPRLLEMGQEQMRKNEERFQEAQARMEESAARRLESLERIFTVLGEAEGGERFELSSAAQEMGAEERQPLLEEGAEPVEPAESFAEEDQSRRDESAQLLDESTARLEEQDGAETIIPEDLWAQMGLEDVDSGEGAEAEGMEAEGAAMGSPLEATGSPLEATGSPLEATGSPLEATGSPLEATGSPLEATGSPLEATGSPLEAADSGRGALDERVEAADSGESAFAQEMEAEQEPDMLVQRTPDLTIQRQDDEPPEISYESVSVPTLTLDTSAITDAETAAIEGAGFTERIDALPTAVQTARDRITAASETAVGDLDEQLQTTKDDLETDAQTIKDDIIELFDTANGELDALEADIPSRVDTIIQDANQKVDDVVSEYTDKCEPDAREAIQPYCDTMSSTPDDGTWPPFGPGEEDGYHQKKADAAMDAALQVGQAYAEQYRTQGDETKNVLNGDVRNELTQLMQNEITGMRDQLLTAKEDALTAVDAAKKELIQQAEDLHSQAITTLEMAVIDTTNDLNEYETLLMGELINGQREFESQVHAAASSAITEAESSLATAQAELAGAVAAASEPGKAFKPGAQAAIDAAAANIESQLAQQVTESAAQIEAQGTTVAGSVGAIDVEAGSGIYADTFEETTGEMTGQVIEGLQGINENMLTFGEQMTTRTTEAFNAYVMAATDAMQQIEDAASTNLPAFIESDFKPAIAEAHLELMPQAKGEGEKAGDAVQPAWKGWLKIIINVVVTALVALVIVAIVVATGGVAGILLGVLAGAAIGALGGAIKCVANNLIDGKPPFEDIGSYMAEGAITGAITGLTAGVMGIAFQGALTAGQFAAKVLIEGAIDTVKDVVGEVAGQLRAGATWGTLDWGTIGVKALQSFVINVTVGAVFEGISQYRLRGAAGQADEALEETIRQGDDADWTPNTASDQVAQQAGYGQPPPGHQWYADGDGNLTLRRAPGMGPSGTDVPRVVPDGQGGFQYADGGGAFDPPTWRPTTDAETAAYLNGYDPAPPGHQWRVRNGEPYLQREAGLGPSGANVPRIQPDGQGGFRYADSGEPFVPPNWRPTTDAETAAFLSGNDPAPPAWTWELVGGNPTLHPSNRPWQQLGEAWDNRDWSQIAPHVNPRTWDFGEAAPDALKEFTQEALKGVAEGGADMDWWPSPTEIADDVFNRVTLEWGVPTPEAPDFNRDDWDFDPDQEVPTITIPEAIEEAGYDVDFDQAELIEEISMNEPDMVPYYLPILLKDE